MKGTTRIYLLAGFYYAIINKFPFESWQFWLGAIFVGLLFGVHKVCLLKEFKQGEETWEDTTDN